MANCKYKTSLGKKMMKLARDVDRTISRVEFDETSMNAIQEFVKIIDEVEKIFTENIKPLIKSKEKQ